MCVVGAAGGGEVERLAKLEGFSQKPRTKPSKQHAVERSARLRSCVLAAPTCARTGPRLSMWG